MIAPLIVLALVVSPGESNALRVLVPDLAAPELDGHQLSLWQQSLRTELDKLEGVTSLGMSDIGPDKNTTRQCPIAETTCLIRLAETLGVDEVLLAETARLGDSRVLTLKRVRIRDAEITGAVTRQMIGGWGEELVLILGNAIAELFPEFPVKAGVSRGVDLQTADAFSRAPLSPWIFGIGAGLTLVALTTGITFGVLAQKSARAYRDYANEGAVGTGSIDGAQLVHLANETDRRQLAANVSYVVAGALAVTSGVLAYFTDWQGASHTEVSVGLGDGSVSVLATTHF